MYEKGCEKEASNGRGGDVLSPQVEATEGLDMLHLVEAEIVAQPESEGFVAGRGDVYAVVSGVDMVDMGPI
jgi:hypothetical protein